MYLYPLHYEEFSTPVQRTLLFDSVRKSRIQPWGNTDLHENIRQQNVQELTNNLIEHPELINIPDLWLTSQSTPLLLAVKQGCTYLAKQLLQHKADPNKTDYKKFSPLHYACIYRLNHLITTLLQAGANPWLKNYYNKTPLDYYLTAITQEDLSYPYLFVNHANDETQLKKVYDSHHNYQGTKCKDYSALRWYVHTVNFNQLAPDQRAATSCSIFPIWHKTHYQQHLDNFLIFREQEYNKKTHHDLVKSLARHLQQEYQHRQAAYFKGFIRHQTLIDKINLTKKILNKEDNTMTHKKCHDGRSRKLYDHYTRFNNTKA